MRRKGPDKYLGKRQYEVHLKHMLEASDKAKLYVELGDKYMLPEYNAHCCDEKYLKKYKDGEIVQILSDDFSSFQMKLLKKHWFLTENFVLGNNYLRLERFVMLKLGKSTGWSSEKMPDQTTFLQFSRFIDRTNCLEIFKFDIPSELISDSDHNLFTQK